jgi:hypothetical protein
MPAYGSTFIPLLGDAMSCSCASEILRALGSGLPSSAPTPNLCVLDPKTGRAINETANPLLEGPHSRTGVCVPCSWRVGVPQSGESYADPVVPIMSLRMTPPCRRRAFKNHF